MKQFWSEILVPAVIAGLTVIGTVGVETSRAVRPDVRVHPLREVRLDTLRKDTIPQDTVRKAAAVKKDTILKDLSLEKPYFQVFARKYGFVPNLSIMDLVFNEGPDAILYLKNL